MSELKQIRKEIRRYVISDFISRFLHDTMFSLALSSLDYIYIYKYDMKKRRGEDQIPLPKMSSKLGQVMLARLLKAYEEENPPQKPPHYPGWTCSCGRENQHYVSTCPCGKNKRDVSQEDQQEF